MWRKLGLGLLLTIGPAGAAAAAPLDDVALESTPQHYLIVLPEAEVGEVAESLLGETLGLPYRIDADVDARMALTIDGVYAPKALVREFGYRLWNAGVVLVETPSGDLWLIPRAELRAAMAQGSEMVSPPAGQAAATPPAVAPALEARPVADANAPAKDLTWLAWLAGGWIAGAASWAAWTHRSRQKTTPVALLEPPPGPQMDLDADDLIIPIFQDHASARKPKAPSPRI